METTDDMDPKPRYIATFMYLHAAQAVATPREEKDPQHHWKGDKGHSAPWGRDAPDN